MDSSSITALLDACSAFVFSPAQISKLEDEYIEISAQKSAATQLREMNDSLFWALFVSHYGAHEFIAINSHYKNRELEEKSAIATLCSTFNIKNKDKCGVLAGIKLSRPHLATIAGGLMADAISGLGILPVFAQYYNMHIRMVDRVRKTYLDIVPVFDDITGNCNPLQMRFAEIELTPKRNGHKYVPIWRQVLPRLGSKLGPNSNLQDIPEPDPTLLKLDSIQRPLRAISTYPIAELKSTAIFLGVNIDPSATKRIIYDALTQYCIPPEYRKQK